MSKEEIQQMVKELLSQEMKKQKQLLANIVRSELEYTGEFAKAYRLMVAIDKWASNNH